MVDEKRKTTVPIPSVGADREQPILNNTNGIITGDESEINHPDEISQENFLEFQRLYDRLNNPAYLHTVTLNELYETAYPSRPPIIDGLLYPGTYLLAGAPKVGKSFLVGDLGFYPLCMENPVKESSDFLWCPLDCGEEILCLLQQIFVTLLPDTGILPGGCQLLFQIRNHGIRNNTFSGNLVPGCSLRNSSN